MRNSPRVVTVSSVAARSGAIDFSDLQATRAYHPMPVYARSKLANLMFAFELQRRSDAEGWGITSIAAHPGVPRTDLIHNGAGRLSVFGFVRTFMWFLFQPAAQGALPILFAATSPRHALAATTGQMISEPRLPTIAKPPQQAWSRRGAAHTWNVSALLTAMTFPKVRLVKP